MTNEFDYPPNRPLPVYINLAQKVTQLAEGGAMSGEPAKHTYVRVSALPDELKRRVIDAVRIITQR